MGRKLLVWSPASAVLLHTFLFSYIFELSFFLRDCARLRVTYFLPSRDSLLGLVTNETIAGGAEGPTAFCRPFLCCFPPRLAVCRISLKM
jgi:hypothetical protein